MLTVELRDTAGRTPVQFDIIPSSGIARSVYDSQLELARRLAPTVGLLYYFLVTTDEVNGWHVSDGRTVFSARTPALLKPYAGSEDKIRQARGVYLAELVQAWVADLASRWKSGTSPAPGERDMITSGALDVIRSTEPMTSGSL